MRRRRTEERVKNQPSGNSTSARGDDATVMRAGGCVPRGRTRRRRRRRRLVRSFRGVHVVVADLSCSRRRRRRRRHHRRNRNLRHCKNNRRRRRRTRFLSNDVDDGVGGVRVAAAVVAANRRGRGLRRVQGGCADDHKTGLTVRPGTVRPGHRPGSGNGQQEVPGPPQGTSEESREQVNLS